MGFKTTDRQQQGLSPSSPQQIELPKTEMPTLSSYALRTSELTDEISKVARSASLLEDPPPYKPLTEQAVFLLGGPLPLRFLCESWRPNEICFDEDADSLAAADAAESALEQYRRLAPLGGNIEESGGQCRD